MSGRSGHGRFVCAFLLAMGLFVACVSAMAADAPPSLPARWTATTSTFLLRFGTNGTVLQQAHMTQLEYDGPRMVHAVGTYQSELSPPVNVEVSVQTVRAFSVVDGNCTETTYSGVFHDRTWEGLSQSKAAGTAVFQGVKCSVWKYSQGASNAQHVRLYIDATTGLPVGATMEAQLGFEITSILTFGGVKAESGPVVPPGVPQGCQPWPTELMSNGRAKFSIADDTQPTPSAGWRQLRVYPDYVQFASSAQQQNVYGIVEREGLRMRRYTEILFTNPPECSCDCFPPDSIPAAMSTPLGDVSLMSRLGNTTVGGHQYEVYGTPATAPTVMAYVDPATRLPVKVMDVGGDHTAVSDIVFSAVDETAWKLPAVCAQAKCSDILQPCARPYSS